MCTITNTIKFCTCKASSTDRLQNYWVLYRRNKDKNIMIIGEVFFPHAWARTTFEDDYEATCAILLHRLKEVDAFDIPIPFKSKDVLELVFNNNTTKRVVYGFKYSKSAWVAHEIDVFELMGRFDALHFGKIKK